MYWIHDWHVLLVINFGDKRIPGISNQKHLGQLLVIVFENHRIRVKELNAQENYDTILQNPSFYFGNLASE